MTEDNRKYLPITLIYISIAAILLVLLFLVHQQTHFMMDDEWYATNLVTGEKLQSFSDILESQKWHYDNWGGRSVTHGILQMTLMSGEFWANIFNMTATLLLVFMICLLSGYLNAFSYVLGLSLVIALNANIKTSMLWQSGTVNYVYATAWILLFLWIYVRALKGTKYRVEKRQNAGTVRVFKQIAALAGISVLGLMTGWSNENMGPASFLFTVGVIGYKYFIEKEKSPLWMYMGAFTTLVGSALCIVAPGNFVRSKEIYYTGLVNMITERMIMMLQAGAAFLLPSVLLCVVLGCMYCRYQKAAVKVEYIMLGVMAFLAFGAMVLSPHFPDRATFGVMCLLIVLILHFLQELMCRISGFRRCGYLLLGISAIISAVKLLSIIVLQGV